MMILMISPAIAEQEISQDILPQTETVETVPQQSVGENITYKQPVSKRKMAKKFLAAMGGVAISSIALFLILSLYNKVRESLGIQQQDAPKDYETSLDTPENLEDAVRVFLEKTKWDK